MRVLEGACGGRKRRNIRMNTLQSAAIAAATVFLGLAFCTGIKAACRKKAEAGQKKIRQYMTDIWGQK